MFYSYRLAPEHKYPTPIDDCWIVTRYIMENPNEFKIDVDRIVLVGDSAGLQFCLNSLFVLLN